MYALSSSPASHSWMFLKRFLFMMKLMVENVSTRIQFELMILLVCDSLLVWVMLGPTCSDCDPVRVLDVDDGKFRA